MATVEGIMRDTLRCKSIIYNQVVREIYQADIFLEADFQLLHYLFNWQRQAGLLPHQFTTNGKKRKKRKKKINSQANNL